MRNFESDPSNNGISKSMKTPIKGKQDLIWDNLAINQRIVIKILILMSDRNNEKLWKIRMRTIQENLDD